MLKIYRFVSKYTIFLWIISLLRRTLLPTQKKIPEGTIVLNPKDVAISGALIFNIFEKTQLEMFRRALKPGMTVVDVGANIGLYTIIASKLVGSGGTVFSFEPEDDNFEILKQNISINNLSNVIPIKKALAEKSGTVQLYLDTYNRGSHSFSNKNLRLQGITIETERLDETLKNYGSPRIDVIKMDIEGAESLALRGMSETLARSTNITMFTEYYPEAIEQVSGSPVDFLNNLVRAGFYLSVINEESGATVDIADAKQFARDFTATDKFVNLLAVKTTTH